MQHNFNPITLTEKLSSAYVSAEENTTAHRRNQSRQRKLPRLWLWIPPPPSPSSAPSSARVPTPTDEDGTSMPIVTFLQEMG